MAKKEKSKKSVWEINGGTIVLAVDALAALKLFDGFVWSMRHVGFVEHGD